MYQHTTGVARPYIFGFLKVCLDWLQRQLVEIDFVVHVVWVSQAFKPIIFQRLSWTGAPPGVDVWY